MIMVRVMLVLSGGKKPCLCSPITTLGQSPAGEDGPSISITPVGEFNFALALCESAKVELHRSAFCIIPHTFCS